MGYIYLKGGDCIYRIGTDCYVTLPYEKSNGIIGVNSKGSVISVSINEENIVNYIVSSMDNPGMAQRFAERNNLKGADELFIQTFDDFISNGQYTEAARGPSINHVKSFFDISNPHSPFLGYFTKYGLCSNMAI